MLNLTNEEKVLLEVIKHGISGKDITINDNDINWDEVIKEAKVQAVTILACDSAAAVKEMIPADTFKSWKALSFKGMMNNLKVQKAQKDMVSIMDKNEYSYIILKGLASASYYPKPELRTLGDVDFLIDPEKKAELSVLFAKNGYSLQHENHSHHVVLKKPDAHLEMHFEPSGVPNGKHGDYVRKFFHNAVYNSIEHRHDGEVFRISQPAVHGMILALHMQHHQVSEGLGLRHLCDWACFVNSTADKPFWAELTDAFKNIGLMTYISLITKTCSMFLGTKLPEWAKNADESLCEEIINDIFAAGNFGRKDNLRSKSGIMVSNHGKDGTHHSKAFYLYTILHTSSAEHKPSVKSNKILWFMEDCRRGALYLARMFSGKRASLIKMVPEAEKRRNLYEEFHLFETENNKN